MRGMKVGSLDHAPLSAPGRGGGRRARRSTSFQPVQPALSAVAVGRTRTVAEPRWSPSGARLAWIESFAGFPAALRAEVAEALLGGAPAPV